MNYSNIVIPVQIESKNVFISFENTEISCKKFIKLALKQNSIEYMSTYSLFEHANGIDRLISKDENIVQLWTHWINKTDVSTKLILRKCHSIEKRLQFKQQKSTTVKSYFKKAKLMSKNIQSEQQEQEENQRLNQFCEIEKDYYKMIKKTTTTRKLLSDSKATTSTMCKNVKLPNMCSYHCNQLNELISEKYENNITFLKFLHMKLKQQNILQTKSKSNDDDLIVSGSTGCSRSNSSSDIGYSSQSSSYDTWV